MTSILQVIEVINKRIKEEFKDIQINFLDITENFKRPSFFIETGKVESENFMGKFNRRTIPIRLIYFPTSESVNQIELLETTDRLNNAFIENKYLDITETFRIEILNPVSFISEKILHFNFEIYIEDKYATKVAEMIEELEMQEDMNGN